MTSISPTNSNRFTALASPANLNASTNVVSTTVGTRTGNSNINTSTNTNTNTNTNDNVNRNVSSRYDTAAGLGGGKDSNLSASNPNPSPNPNSSSFPPPVSRLQLPLWRRILYAVILPPSVRHQFREDYLAITTEKRRRAERRIKARHYEQMLQDLQFTSDFNPTQPSQTVPGTGQGGLFQKSTDGDGSGTVTKTETGFNPNDYHESTKQTRYDDGIYTRESSMVSTNTKQDPGGETYGGQQYPPTSVMSTTSSTNNFAPNPTSSTTDPARPPNLAISDTPSMINHHGTEQLPIMPVRDSGYSVVLAPESQRSTSIDSEGNTTNPAMVTLPAERARSSDAYASGATTSRFMSRRAAQRAELQALSREFIISDFDARMHPCLEYPNPTHTQLLDAMYDFFRRLVSEFVGTFMIVYGIAGMAIENSLGHIDQVGNAIGCGLILMVAVYVFGGISGAHLNPLVTLAFVLRSSIPMAWIPFYWLAQFGGGCVAAAALQAFYNSNAHLGTTTLFHGYSSSSGLLFEAVITMLLIVTILITSTHGALLRSQSALPVGGILGFNIMISISVTGGGMNWFRSFCMALINGPYGLSYYWIYAVGPFIGMVVAVIIAQIVTKRQLTEDPDLVEYQPKLF